MISRFPEEDSAAFHGDQPGQGFQEHGLPRTGWAHQYEELVLRDIQVDIYEFELPQRNIETLDTNHFVSLSLMLSVRTVTNRTRQQKTSQKATGWEYLSPKASKRS